MKTARLISMSKLLPLCVCAALGAQTARAAPVALACDMNDDGRYSIADLLAIHRFCKATGPEPTADSLTCDMNDDGRYSIADLLAIHRFCKTPPPLVGLPLNDTGIDWCANRTQNFLPCPVDGYPEQDGQSGRDVTHDDDSDGHAGFSFTKLDAAGNALSASAAVWSCVRDEVTGLVWEVKTIDGGLRDMDWTYSWYNPDPGTNGGDAGTQDGGSCSGSACDTHAFVQAVNAAGLCGARDWRMPDRFELESITSYDRFYPAIDTAFFPNTQSTWFWSSSPNARYSGYAWSVGFDVGSVGSYYKYYTRYVRLVRAGQ